MTATTLTRDQLRKVAADRRDGASWKTIGLTLGVSEKTAKSLFDRATIEHGVYDIPAVAQATPATLMAAIAEALTGQPAPVVDEPEDLAETIGQKVREDNAAGAKAADEHLQDEHGPILTAGDAETAQAEHDAECATPPAGDQPAPAADQPAADDEHVTHCIKCGFDFKRPQKRRTCKSEAACQKRQEARAAADAA